ncbi:unnamed protein product, partial [Chrysoparadoxa australica]
VGVGRIGDFIRGVTGAGIAATQVKFVRAERRRVRGGKTLEKKREVEKEEEDHGAKSEVFAMA